MCNDHDHPHGVRYAPRLPFGPTNSDKVVGIDHARMLRDRQERMRSVMRAHGVPAILLTGAENVRYLTGFWWSEFQRRVGYALFFTDHPPIVFAPAGAYQQMPDLVPGVDEWRPAISWMDSLAPASAIEMQAARFGDQVRDELKAHGLSAERLAVSEIDRHGRDALSRLGIPIEDGMPLLLESAAIKTPDEISCLQMAASISVTGFETVRTNLRAGTTVSAMSKLARRAIEDAGAENPATGIMSGPHGFERSPTGLDRRIEHGDLAFALTCGTSFLGYSACLYRQFVVGRRPTGEEVSAYSQLRDRLDGAIAAMVPGNSTADVAARLAPAEHWGYKSETECFSVELGHGVGLVNKGSRVIHYNNPIITREWSLEHPEEIREGMVIAIEGIEGEHRQWGVRLENMVLVGPDGPRLLDAYPRDEILVAGL
jgi:Xaa-Pro aminopeptidase